MGISKLRVKADRDLQLLIVLQLPIERRLLIEHQLQIEHQPALQQLKGQRHQAIDLLDPERWGHLVLLGQVVHMVVVQVEVEVEDDKFLSYISD